VRINLETLNFSRAARIKTDHSAYGWLWVRKINHFSVSCAFCLRAKIIGLWRRLEIWNIYLNEWKYEASAAHIENDVKFNLFGSVNILFQPNEGYRLSIQHHNELVDKNRHVLGRIINCIKFRGTHELPLRRLDESETSYNREIFLDLLSEPANLDSVLD
jgi:hypothetical protein